MFWVQYLGLIWRVCYDQLLTLLASSALCASLPLQAQAELDVVSVDSDYPKLDALYKDIHARAMGESW
jgi:hypothetical protein